MKNIIKKVTSRKFIVTAVIITGGLATAFKGSSNEKLQITGYIMAAVAAIVYMIIEGNIDKTSVANETAKAIEGIEIIESEDN